MDLFKQFASATGGNHATTTNNSGMNTSMQTAGVPTQSSGQQAGEGGGDMLDKGLEFLSKKMGRNQSHAETETMSDQVRAGYKKMTGKDIPIKDKEYR